jgi:hypothetical protein
VFLDGCTDGRKTSSLHPSWFVFHQISADEQEFIPHLAKEYGFEYELITYKWPSWLRAQTEKQRVIWACVGYAQIELRWHSNFRRYKILFLDVLFPMDLDKVIFVDAGESLCWASLTARPNRAHGLEGVGRSRPSGACVWLCAYG